MRYLVIETRTGAVWDECASLIEAEQSAFVLTSMFGEPFHARVGEPAAVYQFPRPQV